MSDSSFQSDSSGSSLDDDDYIPQNFNSIDNILVRSKYDFCTKIYTSNSSVPICFAYNSPLLQQYMEDQYVNEQPILSVNNLLRSRHVQNNLLGIEDYATYISELDQNREETQDFIDIFNNRNVILEIIQEYQLQYLQQVDQNYYQTVLLNIKKQNDDPIPYLQQIQKKNKVIKKDRIYNSYTDHQINEVCRKILLGHTQRSIANSTQVKISTVKKLSVKIKNGQQPRTPKTNNNSYLNIPEEIRIQLIQRNLEPQFRSYSIKQRKEYFNNIFNLNNNELQYKSLLESAGFTYRRGINCNQGIWQNQQHDYSVKQVSLRILDYLQKGYDIIAIDETGLNNSVLKNYGWFPKGTGQIQFPRQVGFYNKSFCVAISYKYGFITAQYKNHGYTSPYFRYFLTKTRQKYRQISNYNDNFVILMDNASIHKTKWVITQLIDDHIDVIFNATYTPRLNPIEQFFGVFKKKLQTFYESTEQEIQVDSYEAIISITTETVRKCFLNSFVYAYYRLFEQQ